MTGGREEELKRRGGVDDAKIDDLAAMSIGGEEEVVLKEIRTSIRLKAEKGGFKIGGMTAPVSYLPQFAQGFAQGYLSAVPGHTKSNETFSTPKTAAQIDRLCTAGISSNGKSPATPSFVALVQVIAEAKYVLNTSDPQGKDRDPDTRKFYEDIANRSGITIFPDKPAMADAFDQAVALEVKKLNFKNNKEYQEKFNKFERDMQTDSQNMSTVIEMLASLPSPNENDPHFNEGLALLSDILMRMMYTFSKDNLELVYKKDFFKVFEEIYPNAAKSEMEKKIDSFLHHHITMMSTLEDQFKQLYLDLAVNTCALGLQAAAPGITTAVSPLIGSGITSFVQNATLGAINPSALVGSAPSNVVGLGAQNLSKFNNPPSPIRAPTRPESRFAMYTRYKEEKPKQLALLGATVAAGLLTGPIGAVIVGIVGGGMAYAPKFYNAYTRLSDLEKHTNEEKTIHQKQCSQFFNAKAPAHDTSSTTKMLNRLPDVESKTPPRSASPDQVSSESQQASPPTQTVTAAQQAASPSPSPSNKQSTKTTPRYHPGRRF